MEANSGSSRKDFKNKIYICKKEVEETKHWLRMLVKCLLGKEKELNQLKGEAQELTLIFGKILSSLRANEQSIKNSSLKHSLEIQNS